MTDNNWVVDITLYNEDNEDTSDLLCFVPVEHFDDPEKRAFVVGMNYLTSPEGFSDRGKLVGIIHADGQEAIDKWVEDHPDLMKRLERIRVCYW